MAGYQSVSDWLNRVAGFDPPKVDLGITSAENGTYNAVTVESAATLIKAANTSRRAIVIQNLDAAKDLFLGLNANITVANGVKIPPGGQAFEDRYSGAIYCIVASGSVAVRYLEV